MKCWLCGQKVPEKARNYKHHCKLFVLFQIGLENWEPESETIINGERIQMTDEQFRENVLTAIGHCDQYFDFNGNIKFKAKSISYAKLGQEGFQKVYDRCLKFIADKLLKCGRAELHDEVIWRFG